MKATNLSTAPRIARSVIPSPAATTLKQYNYFDSDRPVDKDGFPVVKATLEKADLKAGVEVSLPSRGVVFLTTME